MNSEKWYDYVILPSFEEDMQRIQNYITYHLMNPLAAAELAAEVEEAIEKRRFFAEAYEKYSSSRRRKHPYYRIQVKGYTVFYAVKGRPMEIRRIFHSSQNIQGYI